MKRKVITLGIATATVLLFSFLTPVGRYFNIAKNLEIFAAVFRAINEMYVEDVNPNQLIEAGMKSMLKTLDPYTNFIPEDKIENYRTVNTGQYGGIGARSVKIGDRTVIDMIYEGYPAAAPNGLKVGDEIIKVGEKDLASSSIEEVVQLIQGQIGTPIHLTVKRPGTEGLLQLEFVRKKVKIKSVPYHSIIDKDIGYIKLAAFTPKAGKEVRDALVAMDPQNLKGIVLDLRNNPGGLLIESVRICGLFLPRGSEIVKTRGKRKKSNVSYATQENPIALHTPLVVLIDGQSASASEIVAGSLQDYDRAVIVGQKSFGKGLVQLNLPLPYNAQLKVTTAKYYTPSGRCIQALNYNKREQDGSVSPTPDSLKKEFKTTRGRSVYDGGGIGPDVVVAPLQKHHFSQTLDKEGLIFDYATAYVLEHDTLDDGKTFTLNKEEYTAFEKWLQDKNYDYQSPLEQELETFEKLTKEDQQFDEFAAAIKTIKQTCSQDEQTLTRMYKEEIQHLLEASIVSRHHFQKGVIQLRLAYDPLVAESVAILNDTTTYDAILHKSH